MKNKALDYFFETIYRGNSMEKDAADLISRLSEKERLLIIISSRDLTIGKLMKIIELLEEVIKLKDDIIISLRNTLAE